VSVDGLVARWGADPIQWRALVRALLRIDFPSAVKVQTSEEKKKVRGITFVLLIFVLYGITPAVVVLTANDVLLGATVSVAISAFAVAMTLLSGEATELLSAQDFQVLGHRPVSSQTYLAVRATTLIVRSLLVSGATSLLPIAAFTARFGLKGAAHAVGLAIGTQLAGAAATFGIIVLYATLLERVGPERIRKYIAYANVMASTVVWLGFIVVTQDLVKRYVSGVTMNPALWMWFPATWFASLVPLAGGSFSVWAGIGAVLGIGSLAWLTWTIRDRLSMGYTESLTRTATEAAPVSTARPQRVTAWMPAIRNEGRAVLLLARSQIVHDMKFRIALLTLLPMTAFYMFANGMPSDPFLRLRAGNAPIVQMIVIFLPMMVRQVIVQSESHKASWIFHTTAARRSTLLVASRNVTAVFFLMPYLAILAAFFSYAFSSSAHALTHVAFMGLLSAMMLQFDIMIRPQLPFSMAPMKDTRFGAQFFVMMVGGIAGTGFYFLLTKFAYRSVGRMVAAASICVALIALMEWVARRRINGRRVEDLYFD
jgi:hypothetical protein